MMGGTTTIVLWGLAGIAGVAMILLILANVVVWFSKAVAMKCLEKAMVEVGWKEWVMDPKTGEPILRHVPAKFTVWNHDALAACPREFEDEFKKAVEEI